MKKIILAAMAVMTMATGVFANTFSITSTNGIYREITDMDERECLMLVAKTMIDFQMQSTYPPPGQKSMPFHVLQYPSPGDAYWGEAHAIGNLNGFIVNVDCTR